jgi:TorA maturation chaperone TorD
MATEEVAPSLDLLDARSAAYGFLGACLTPPEESVVAVLKDESCWSTWPAQLAESDSDFAELIRLVREKAAEPDVLLKLQNSCARLFGHAVRGQCPPYELEYGWSEINQQASELADINGFYTAFGVTLNDDSHERADHAAAECGFMSILMAKHAYCLQQADLEGQEIIERTVRLFVADHLGRWLPSFAHRLTVADSAGFYGAVGGFASRFISAECTRLDVPRGPRLLQLRDVTREADGAISCGGAEGCSREGNLEYTQLEIDPAILPKA